MLVPQCLGKMNKAFVTIATSTALALLAATTIADTLPEGAIRGEWCRRACQGAVESQCPSVCPPPTVNLSCPTPPREPPCPACSVACPQPVCPEPVCPKPVCPQPVCPACPEVTAAPAPHPVHTGYETVAGVSAYKLFHEQLLDWAAARDRCVEQGAHLAIPNSQAEADLLVKEMGVHKISWAHIGFHDYVIEGQYTTVLGQPLDDTGYVKWGPGQPNGGIRQNCGFIWSDGDLADGDCNTQGPYICEMAFVPRHG